MLLGSAYRVVRALTSVGPHWWKKTTAPRDSTASQNG